MDNLYQAIKGLCKAIINLFVALLDLLAGIFNGIACLFEKIRPRASRQFHEIRENGGLKFSSFQKKSGEEKDAKKLFGKSAVKGADEVKIQSIRERLTGKVTNRDTYYQAYNEASCSSRERELIILIAFLSLLSVILLLGMTGISGGIWLVLTIVILLIALAACAMVYFLRKKEQNNSLTRMILEEEFAEYKSVVPENDAREETKATVSEVIVESVQGTVPVSEAVEAEVVTEPGMEEKDEPKVVSEVIVKPVSKADTETAENPKVKNIPETVEERDSESETEPESEIKQEAENIE